MLHLFLSLLHLIQGIVQLVLGLNEPKYLDVTRTNINGPPWHSPGVNVTQTVSVIGVMQPKLIVASYFMITALSHLIQYFKPHVFIRWAEYSITSTLMMVVILGMMGILDLNAICLGATCNFAMIILGLKWIARE